MLEDGELNEPVISSSGCKMKIKAEMFSRVLEKAACYNNERKLCVNHIHNL